MKVAGGLHKVLRLQFEPQRTIWGFYFGENRAPLASSLVSLEAKLFPSVCLSVIFASSLLEGINALFCTHTHTPEHTCSFKLSSPPLFFFFFAPSPFSMPLLLYSASLGCLWQWHTVVLCDEPTSGAAVPHKGASTFNRYWRGLSLSLWSPGHLLYLHFLLFRHTSPSLCLPSFHVLFGCRHFIFHFSLCALILFFCFLSSSLLVSFCVVRLHTGVNNDPFSKVFTAHAVQYYRFIHLYIMFFF